MRNFLNLCDIIYKNYIYYLCQIKYKRESLKTRSCSKHTGVIATLKRINSNPFALRIIIDYIKNVRKTRKRRKKVHTPKIRKKVLLKKQKARKIYQRKKWIK